MTKQEHNKLQELLNRLSTYQEEQDKAFNELKEMSGELGMPRWCSITPNFRQIMKMPTDKPYVKNGACTSYKAKAQHLYEKYLELEGKIEILEELGYTLADLNFWK